MKERYACVDLFSTRIPVAGWGSLALLAIAAVLVTAVPAAQALTLLGVLGGAAFGTALIVLRAPVSLTDKEKRS